MKQISTLPFPILQPVRLCLKKLFGLFFIGYLLTGSVMGQSYDTITTTPVRVADSMYRVPVGRNGFARNSVNGVVFRKNSLVTHQDTQYVAYYDSTSYLVLGKRKVNEARWIVNRTTYTGSSTDAHNCISIMVDGGGYLHVSWNHHGNILHYAKGIAPGSLTLTAEMPMIGLNETNVTYPEFFSLPNGDLIFFYRDGASGNGNTVLNCYTTATQTWARVQTNLISGQNTRNAYIQSTVDRFGYIHVSWVWRESSNVATNHDMNYAVSYDGGVTWKKSTGAAYTIPITQATAEIVATIPQNSDLINQTSMTTDEDGRPYIASYWKESTGIAPQYHIIYKTSTGWTVTNLGFRTQNFSLAGSGTQVIPIARPQVLAWKRGNYIKAMLVFRDAERAKRISIVTNDSLGTAPWRISDAGMDVIGDWEPSFDTDLWKNRRQINVFGQYMLQGPNETNTNTAPQPVFVLQIDTAAKGSAIAAFADTVPVVATGNWNALLQAGGVMYLPNDAATPTALTGTLGFNSATATGTGVTAVIGGRLTTSTNTAEYFIPKVISSGTTTQRGQLLAYSNPAFVYQADSVLEIHQNNVAGAANKFTLWGLNSSRTIDMLFNVQFGNTGTSNAATYALSLGREDATGSTNTFNTTTNLAPVYTNTNNANIFSTLRWDVDAAGVISLSYRTGVADYSPIANLNSDTSSSSYYVPFSFVKGQYYTVKIWATTQSTQVMQYYVVNNVQYTIRRGTYDVWVNNQLVASDVPSLRTVTGTIGLANGTAGVSINSFTFEGVRDGSSTNEWMKIKDIVWESVNNSNSPQNPDVIILPITWKSFTATKQAGTIVLNWSTAVEMNNRAFELERSTDGKHFALLAMVNSVGNSSSVSTYSHIDNQPVKGINYYRLRQTDRDGRGSYSRVLAVLFSEKGSAPVVYTTPAQNKTINIVFTTEMKAISISLIGNDGKLLLQKKIGSTTNGQVVQLAINTLASGVYTIHIASANGITTQRVVIE